MTTPTTTTTTGTGQRAEGFIQVAIMLTIGAMAGAASFTHVHDVAVTHGQPDWIGWADAVVVELMSIALGLELRRRARTARPVAFIQTALVFFILVSLSAQVVEAETSIIGWLAAGLPALGFLVIAKVVLSRTAATTAATHPAPELAGHDGRADTDNGITVPAAPLDTDEPADPVTVTPVEVMAPVPTHLLPTARFAVVNHEQTHGRPITTTELAARMSITTLQAGQLLAALGLTTDARVNGTRIEVTA
jgi:hypothetical protein